MKKEIKVKDRVFLYEVCEIQEPFGIEIYTKFYDTNVKIKMVKKYRFFGPIIQKKIYNYLFTIYVNIENPIFNKNEIYKAIRKKVRLIEREEEIKRVK
jgi:hypothetical protein